MPTNDHRLSDAFLDDEDGLLPTLNLSQVLIQSLKAPLPVLWALTLPFGAALALLGHPWLGLGSCLGNMLADAVVQNRYRTWEARDGVNGPAGIPLKVGVALALRACAAMVWPVAAALIGGAAKDFMFLGLMSCLLMSVAIAQGGLSAWLFWLSAAPVLAGLALIAILTFPPLVAVGLLIGVAMLGVMLSVMSGNVARLLSEWSAMRDRNNTLIDRLKAERAQAEAAREEARAAALAKSSFLATMSHEIRTPMNGVLGMAQLLKSSATAAQRDQVDTLIHSGEFLMSILNDILDISRIDAGRMDIVATPQDLPALAGELTGFWQGAAQQKGLSLTLEMDADAPRAVMVDGRRLRQVLFNLIGNALKFTPEGGVAVKISATPAPEAPLDKGQCLLTVSVADSGIGIAPDALPRIFGAFSQADESSARGFGGAGLGLSISSHLTELMGGRIWADSVPGQGSTFHIALPVEVLVPAACVNTLAAAPAGAAGPAPALSILAVDDNPVNLMVVEQILAAYGHQITRAASGPEALEHLEDGAFDVVLMDIQMPGMSGVEALAALRASAGPNRDIPVLAVSADVLSHDRAGYLSLGFTGQVSKPIQIAALLSEVAAVSGAAPEAPRATARTAA